jgi:hypothetical protein
MPSSIAIPSSRARAREGLDLDFEPRVQRQVVGYLQQSDAEFGHDVEHRQRIERIVGPAIADPDMPAEGVAADAQHQTSAAIILLKARAGMPSRVRSVSVSKPMRSTILSRFSMISKVAATASALSPERVKTS